MITVNGQQISWHPGLTVAELLQNLDEKFPIIVVRVNGMTISKKEFDTFKIPDKAEVNTVEIIAGG